MSQDIHQPPPKPVAIPPAWTVNDVLRHIPEEWRDGIICHEDGIGRAYPIKRVLLSFNHSGKKVVILCSIEQQIKKWE